MLLLKRFKSTYSAYLPHFFGPLKETKATFRPYLCDNDLGFGQVNTYLPHFFGPLKETKGYFSDLPM